MTERPSNMCTKYLNNCSSEVHILHLSGIEIYLTNDNPRISFLLVLFDID